jgi:sec-independent protein translocase protein TatA
MVMAAMITLPFAFFAGSWGAPEILVILAIVLIVFGVGKLPKAMGAMGKGIRNFKKSAAGEDVDEGKSETKEDTAKDTEKTDVSGSKTS